MNFDVTITSASAHTNQNEPAREADTAAGGRYLLTFLRGRFQGKCVAIDAHKNHVVGRAEGCDLVVDDPSVSRQHLVLEASGDGAMSLRDCGSRNGTRINGRRLNARVAVEVQPGDKIQIGEDVIVRFDAYDRMTDAAQSSLYAAAVRDPLTGTFNKRYLLESLSRDFALSRRHGVAINALMIDVDHFKKINDTHGHLVGDEVLKKLARATGLMLRTEDLFGRFGGEEFAIITKNQSLQEALALAERIRACIARQPLAGIDVTISIGVAGTGEKAYNDVDELLHDADQMLYRAKHAGRNRAVGATA